jgi:hypothetical protein
VAKTFSRTTDCYYIRDDDDLSLVDFVFPTESLDDTDSGVCSFQF